MFWNNPTWSWGTWMNLKMMVPSGSSSRRIRLNFGVKITEHQPLASNSSYVHNSATIESCCKLVWEWEGKVTPVKDVVHSISSSASSKMLTIRSTRPISSSSSTRQHQSSNTASTRRMGPSSSNRIAQRKMPMLRQDRWTWGSFMRAIALKS